MGKGKKKQKVSAKGGESQNSDNSKKAIPIWKVFCYDTSETPNLWKVWYDGVDGRVRAAHDVAVDYLLQREQHEWQKTPYFGPLVPKEGIYEIRIRGNVQWRLAGYFGPGQKEFTIVLACTHKQQIYDPPDAKETAVKRKKQIDKGERKRILSARPRTNQPTAG